MQRCKIKLLKHELIPLGLPFFQEPARLEYGKGKVEIFSENADNLFSSKPTELKGLEYIHQLLLRRIVVYWWDKTEKRWNIAIKDEEAGLKLIDYLATNKCSVLFRS